ncbi:MAG TPA: hypothetical protein VF980_07020 [Thermoanaerobaculia bacterium]
MNRKLHTTPVIPCCDACITTGFARAAFDYAEPFVIYTGFRGMSARARREFVEHLLANCEGEIAVVVSTPVPAECRSNETAAATQDTGEDAAASPTPEQLSEILGVSETKE